jgi:hypothetical protein
VLDVGRAIAIGRAPAKRPRPFRNLPSEHVRLSHLELRHLRFLVFNGLLPGAGQAVIERQRAGQVSARVPYQTRWLGAGVFGTFDVLAVCRRIVMTGTLARSGGLVAPL